MPLSAAPIGDSFVRTWTIPPTPTWRRNGFPECFLYWFVPIDWSQVGNGVGFFWRALVDASQIAVAATAIALAAREARRDRLRLHQNLVETFWLPAEDACMAITNWNLVPDASTLADYLNAQVTNLRRILPRAARVPSEFQGAVAKVREAGNAAAIVGMSLGNAQDMAGIIIEKHASRFFNDPGRREKPTLQTKGHRDNWENYSIWALLQDWYTGREPISLNGMSVQYGLQGRQDASDYLMGLWNAWDASEHLRTLKQQLEEMEATAMRAQIACESVQKLPGSKGWERSIRQRMVDG